MVRFLCNENCFPDSGHYRAALHERFSAPTQIGPTCKTAGLPIAEFEYEERSRKYLFTLVFLLFLPIRSSYGALFDRGGGLQNN